MSLDSKKRTAGLRFQNGLSTEIKALAASRSEARLPSERELSSAVGCQQIFGSGGACTFGVCGKTSHLSGPRKFLGYGICSYPSISGCEHMVQ